MAKLFFYYAAMNAGKSTVLLQSSYNYRERGMQTMLFTPELDNRFARGKVYSRIGLHADANLFARGTNLLMAVQQALSGGEKKLSCVLIDEAQFLSKVQVEQLVSVVDELRIPVLCYGLRTDFRGELFEGSQYLLAWAEELIEIKTICHCGRKATMNMRLDENGSPVRQGEQIKIGGNETYISTCRIHFKTDGSHVQSDAPACGQVEGEVELA